MIAVGRSMRLVNDTHRLALALPGTCAQGVTTQWSSALTSAWKRRKKAPLSSKSRRSTVWATHEVRERFQLQTRARQSNWRTCGEASRSTLNSRSRMARGSAG